MWCPGLERVSSNSYCISKNALLNCDTLEGMRGEGSFSKWLNLILFVEWNRWYIISDGWT